MSERTLYDAVWDRHAVRELPTGATQLAIGLHLLHEVTSPQAFGMLAERDLEVAYPERTHVTADHIVPTDDRSRPYDDEDAEAMLAELERNVRAVGLSYDPPASGDQGIVHVIGPEQGLTQPGMTIACGDSHTATHGAFGALGFGVGTSQIRDILATGTVALEKQGVRKIQVDGELGPWVGAKDIVLTIIRRLGTDGGTGYVYEYAGDVIESLDMPGRMTLCNMSIEGGARAGYVNPDETTYDWLRETDYFRENQARFDELLPYWESIRSGPDAVYDDVVTIDGSAIEPTVSWGTDPSQVVGISEPVPDPDSLPATERDGARKAQEHTGVTSGESMRGYEIDVAFVGSCTNARLRDLERAAAVLDGREIDPAVRGLVVPGSERVRRRAEDAGLDDIFTRAGFEWRQAGCSMCLGLNSDQLRGAESCASSSNRNFIGRQGSQDGRTILMSPAMVAAAAVEGAVTDVRELDASAEVSA